MTGAIWGVRQDGSSQGGYVVMVCHSKVSDGEDSDSLIVDRKSFKLIRLARSSLHAESQAAASGMDALAVAKRFWAALIHGNANFNFGESPCYAG
eukprot:7808587-Pyramimonas_sp.AAC.2